MTESKTIPELPAGEPDWEAVARHLAGESSASESAAVGAWLSAHPADARAIAALSALASQPGHRSADVDVETALARVHERMRMWPTQAVPLRAVARATRRSFMPWSMAAAAVLVITAGVVLSRRYEAAGPVADARSFATATGQVDSTRLTDGTHVILGPSSELTILAGYGAGRREVQLRGTAFFEVRHDVARPFTVRTGSVAITDIGTMFAVRDDGADGVEVSVREGAVRLQAGTAVVELAAGDFAAVRQSGIVLQRSGASDNDVAWTMGRLVFRETPLARVRTDLRRWFGVELVVTDSALASRHLTASFTNDSQRQVLDVIALALGATYDVRGDTVTLRPAPLTVRPR
ncbi:MAG: hypothetical protein C0497_14410 [Gemmatimonas sp.]|nr:hypothetical protein [Gemmatimonas sp.]